MQAGWQPSPPTWQPFMTLAEWYAYKMQHRTQTIHAQLQHPPPGDRAEAMQYARVLVAWLNYEGTAPTPVRTPRQRKRDKQRAKQGAIRQGAAMQPLSADLTRQYSMQPTVQGFSVNK